MTTHDDSETQHSCDMDRDAHFAESFAHAEQAAAKNIPINYNDDVTWRVLDGLRVNLAEISSEHRANILVMLEKMASDPARRANYISMAVHTLVTANVHPGETAAIVEQLIRVNSTLALHNTPLARKLVELNA